LGEEEADEADAVIAKRRGRQGDDGGPEKEPPAWGYGMGADGLKRVNTELKSPFP